MKKLRIKEVQNLYMYVGEFYPQVYKVQVKGLFFWHTIATFQSETGRFRHPEYGICWYDFGRFQAEELLDVLQKVNQ